MTGRKLLLLLGSICLILVFAALPLMTACEEEVTPPAEEPILLTYGSFVSSTHYMSLADVEWQQWITDESGGIVQWQNYFGGTVVTLEDGMNQIASGVVDLGNATPTLSPGYDLTNNTGSFLCGISDRTKYRQAAAEIEEQFPEILAEVTTKNLVPLGTFGLQERFALATVSVPIHTLADVVGLQMRAVGIHTDFAYLLGCTPVGMPIGDTVVSLEKHIVDGTFLSSRESLKSFGLADVVNYVTWLNYYHGGVLPCRVMNLDSWNRLPADIQQIFIDSIPVLESLNDEYSDIEAQAGLDYAEQMGVQFFELSSQDQATFSDIIQDALMIIVDQLDDKGLPGTEIYNACLALNEKYSQ